MNEGRDDVIVAEHHAGKSLAAIGRRFNLTRERVRQIVVKHHRRQRDKVFAAARADISAITETSSQP